MTPRSDHWHGMTAADRRRLDGLVGTLPGAVVYRLVMDADGTPDLVYVSPTIEENFGLRADDVLADVGRWYAMVHRGDLARVMGAQRRAFDAREPLRVTARYVLPDGGTKLFEIHASPEVLGDGCIVWNGVATDVTEAAAVRAERGRLLNLVDATTDLVCVVRAKDGSFESANQAARTLMRVEDIERLNIRDFYAEGDLRTLTEGAQAAAERGEAWSGVLPLKTPDGTIPFEQTVVASKGPDGRATHYASIGRDLTERQATEAALREANEQVQVALREVNHRIKNFFALVPALVKLSARSADSVEGLSDAVQARIGALSRSHALTLNAFSQDFGIELGALIRAVLEPYADAADLFVLEGPELRLSGRVGNAVALALHELATNAAKHGVFSTPGGHVRIRWDTPQVEGERGLTVRWSEDGGPPVEGPPTRQGFGTSLLDRLIAAQGGEVAREWRRQGLRVTLALPRT